MPAQTDPATQFRPPPVAEMAWRKPAALPAGVASQMIGYREAGKGHFRQIEAASLDIPLVISFGEPFAIGLGRPPGGNDRFASFTAGLFSGPVTIDSFGSSHCLQVNLTPLGARRFFRVPMTELTDRMIALDDILGPEGACLRDRLEEAWDWETRFDIVEKFILRRTAEADGRTGEIAFAMDAIVQSGGKVRVASLARQIGWSRKHLSQRFRIEVGLGPKPVSRIVRINRAIEGARKGDNWAGIAADCGYADQAHLVREFRELAGQPPTAWTAG